MKIVIRHFTSLILVLCLLFTGLPGSESKKPKPKPKPKGLKRVVTCPGLPVLHGADEALTAKYNNKTQQIYRLSRVPVDKGTRKLDIGTTKGGHIFVEYSQERSLKKLEEMNAVPMRTWLETNTSFKPKKVLTGNHIAVSAVMPSHYGHFLHDVLPTVAFLRDQKKLGEDKKAVAGVILQNSSAGREILSWLDPKFEERTNWIRPKYPVRIKAGQLHVMNASTHTHNVMLVDMMKKWVSENHKPSTEPPAVVYYSSTADSAHHSHDLDLIESSNEAGVIEAIKAAMTAHGRTERFVVYNGISSGMSLQATYDLFNSATLVVGPHGAGLVNIVWMGSHSSMPEDCSKRPKVLEFVDGSMKTHWNMCGTAPWVEWHHMMYTGGAESKATGSSVDLAALKVTLDELMKPQ